MKCHDCKKRMPRSELKKHTCKPYASGGLTEKARTYLKWFGSRPLKKGAAHGQ